MFRGINIPDRLIVVSSDLGIEAMQVAIFDRGLHLGRDIKLLHCSVRGQKIVCRIIFFTRSVIIISSMSILNFKLTHINYVTIRLQRLQVLVN